MQVYGCVQPQQWRPVVRQTEAGCTLAGAGRDLGSLWVDEGPFYLSRANTVFDSEGRLEDAELRARLSGYIDAFSASLA